MQPFVTCLYGAERCLWKVSRESWDIAWQQEFSDCNGFDEQREGVRGDDNIVGIHCDAPAWNHTLWLTFGQKHPVPFLKSKARSNAISETRAGLAASLSTSSLQGLRGCVAAWDRSVSDYELHFVLGAELKSKVALLLRQHPFWKGACHCLEELSQRSQQGCNLEPLMTVLLSYSPTPKNKWYIGTAGPSTGGEAGASPWCTWQWNRLCKRGFCSGQGGWPSPQVRRGGRRERAGGTLSSVTL